jgi:hypothetical protein
MHGKQLDGGTLLVIEHTAALSFAVVLPVSASIV